MVPTKEMAPRNHTSHRRQPRIKACLQSVRQKWDPAKRDEDHKSRSTPAGRDTEKHWWVRHPNSLRALRPCPVRRIPLWRLIWASPSRKRMKLLQQLPALGVEITFGHLSPSGTSLLFSQRSLSLFPLSQEEHFGHSSDSAIITNTTGILQPSWLSWRSRSYWISSYHR